MNGINKKELASKIWSGAVALRGNISASNYKDYMLGLIFYKYLSDKEVKFLKDEYYTDEKIKSLTENDTEIVEQCKKQIGYFIEYKNLFSTWIKSWSTDDAEFEVTLQDIRTALNCFERLIGDNHKKVFTKIFDTLNKGIDSFGSNDVEKLKSLKKLIVLINQIPTDSKQKFDVLGFVYEFLLKNFAIKANKGGGEFYTPSEAATIMSEILLHHLKGKRNINIYDPTSGSASLLINIGKKMSKNIGGINNITFYAQEVIPETYNLTRMNLIMHDVDPANIYARRGDTLETDWPFFEDDKPEEYRFLSVDGCCSNPPYSQAWDTKDKENDPRFKYYGVAPKGKADLAFLLHSLYHLNDDGIMTIVLPHGVLFRGGAEKDIRTKLIEKGNIDTIIGLPANIFYGTGIPTIIMVLKKKRDTNDILFVDASKGFVKDGNKNKLRQRDIKKIVDTVIKRDKKSVKGYSRLVGLEEIVENDYNLNIPRYVDSSEKPENYDLLCTTSGGVPNSEIDEFKDYWDAFKDLRESIFKKENEHLSTVLTNEFKNVIYENKDVDEFISVFSKKIDDLPKYLKAKLIDHYKDIDVSAVENEISEKLRDVVTPFPLVDYYDTYQLFADVWEDVSFDLELLQSDEGVHVFNQIVEIKEYKKKKGGDELEEEVIDVQGKIFNFDFIQKEFFKEKYEELQKYSSLLAQSKTEEDEIYSELDEDGKENIAKDDEEKEGYDSAKLKKEEKRIKEEMEKGAAFDEGSYEDIIIRFCNKRKESSSINTKKRKLTNELRDLTFEKIDKLTPAEGFKLLEKKWILSLAESVKKTPKNLMDKFAQKISALCKKYELTLNDVQNDIDKTEIELSSLLTELNADNYNSKGLESLKKLLSDNKKTEGGKDEK